MYVQGTLQREEIRYILYITRSFVQIDKSTYTCVCVCVCVCARARLRARILHKLCMAIRAQIHDVTLFAKYDCVWKELFTLCEVICTKDDVGII